MANETENTDSESVSSSGGCAHDDPAQLSVARRQAEGSKQGLKEHYAIQEATTKIREALQSLAELETSERREWLSADTVEEKTEVSPEAEYLFGQIIGAIEACERCGVDVPVTASDMVDAAFVEGEAVQVFPCLTDLLE